MDNFFVFSNIADTDNETNKKEAARIKKSTPLMLKEEILEEYGTCLGGLYRYVEDTEVLNSLIDRCLEETLPHKNKLISIDYETSGLDPHSDIIFIMGFAWENNNSEIECVVFDNRKVEASYPHIRKLLTKGRNLAHNGGFEYGFGLSAYGVKTRIAFDSQIARQVGWAGLGKGAALDDIVEEFLQMEMDKTVRKDFPRIDKTSPLHNIHFSYNAGDCVTTLLCVPHLIKRLVDEDLWDVWSKIEQPLVSVLAEIKYNGVWIDFEAVDYLHKMLYEKYEEALIEYKNLLLEYKFPEDMLFGSSQQIIKAFYEIEGIELDSTQKSIFEKMDHPLAKSIVKCRNISHMISTYAEPYLNKIPEKTINPDKCGKAINSSTGRVHTELRQCFTDTARLSSRDPNLQNIPSRTKDAKYFRKIFKGPEGHQVIIEDYSQFEIRVLAEEANEVKMIEIFNKGFEIGNKINEKMLSLGIRWPQEEDIKEAAKSDKELEELLRQSEAYDLHRQTAAALYNKKVSEVTRGERGAGKTVSFGVPYGRGPKGIYEESYDVDTDTYALSLEEAGILLNKYAKSYPRAWEHLNLCKKKAINLGFSKTMSGRKRYYNLPDPRKVTEDDLKRMKAEIERQGCNAPIQGCNADVTKLAMVNSHYALKKHFPKAGLLWSVHDELVAHAPEEEAEDAAQVIHDEMVKAAQVWLKKVPVVVGVTLAPAWTK